MTNLERLISSRTLIRLISARRLPRRATKVPATATINPGRIALFQNQAAIPAVVLLCVLGSG